MTAKEYLQQYERIDIEIKILEQEKQDLHNMMHSLTIRTGERVQHSRNIDRYGTIYAEIEQREILIAGKLEEQLKLRARIFEEIDTLPEERYKYILYCRYVQLQSWEKISESMYMCERHVLKLHGKALDTFQNVYCDMLEHAG